VKAFGDMVTVLHGKLGDVIKDHDRIKDINICFFDYMGTPTGNKTQDIFPLRDIDCFLQTTERTQVLLACTFCYRINPRTHIPEDLQEVYDTLGIEHMVRHHLLADIFSKNRFVVSREPCQNPYSYHQEKGQAMMFFMFVLTKTK
jgi:hypothetical protein